MGRDSSRLRWVWAGLDAVGTVFIIANWSNLGSGSADPSRLRRAVAQGDGGVGVDCLHSFTLNLTTSQCGVQSFAVAAIQATSPPIPTKGAIAFYGLPPGGQFVSDGLNSLQGSDFACGDTVNYLAMIYGDSISGPAAAGQVL